MHDIQSTAIPLIEQFSGYAALIAFGSAFGETLIGLGMLLPGSTILLIMGVLAGQGYLNITTVLFFGILGAWLGDSVNYHLGKKYGTSLFQRPWLHIPPSTIDRAHTFLDSHGAKSILFSRFLPGLKETIPFIAGSAQMDRRKFLIWNLFGAIGWSFEFIGMGYLFSSSLSLAQTWMSRTAIIIAVLLGTGMILWVLKRFLQSNIPAILSIFKSMRDGFMQSPPLLRFAAKHPKIAIGISRRFDRTRFIGFPLTVLGLGFGYVLLLFGGIIEDFLTQDSIIYVDHITANLMAQWRTPELTWLLTWITYLGRELVVVAVILSATIILWVYRRYDALLSFAFVEGGALFFMWLSKLAFHRPRPDIALYFESTYSFPSGHATFAVALYGFIGYLLIQEISTLSNKLNTIFVTTILVLGIGLSRIYLGEHYLSDVYAGFLLGTLWVIVGITIFQWRAAHSVTSATPPKRLAKQHLQIVSAATLISLSVTFVGYNTAYPYPPARHTAPVSVTIQDPAHYFAQEENRYTRNLLGIQSRPINLLLSMQTNPCQILNQEGWHTLSKSNLFEPPLFWHADKPLCRLAQKSNGHTYLLSIWKPKLQYKAHTLYLGAADMIIGKQWNILSLYTQNISEARDHAAISIAKALKIPDTERIYLSEPSIRKHLNHHPYFSDGKAVWIKAKQPILPSGEKK